VTTSNVPASQAANESSFFLALMPNRGRTRFLRGAVRFFLGVGVLGCLSVGVSVFLEFYARYSWPVAQGEVVAADVKASEGGTGRQHFRNYYVEYQVRFAVPANECLTGTTSSDQQEHLPCWGIVRTRNTRSSSTAADWLMRQRFNSAVGILHDPNGPGLKIADESPWLVYPWTEIFTMFIWMGLFLTFLNITQRRLQYLETLPDDYDESPPPSSQPPGPNDLIDLKLS
jgi:hypothetical protein